MHARTTIRYGEGSCVRSRESIPLLAVDFTWRTFTAVTSIVAAAATTAMLEHASDHSCPARLYEYFMSVYSNVPHISNSYYPYISLTMHAYA